MKLIKSASIQSKHHNRSIACDIRYIENGHPKPILIFVHGFKGFKDWGPFNLVSEYFADRKYVFLKFNLSHNGTTPETPLEFTNLEAFGENNYIIELDDLAKVIDHLFDKNFPVPPEELDLNKIFLTGHSRGGGVAIIKAAEESRIRGLATWASVDSLAPNISETELSIWKKEGVKFIYNGRTKQNMPMNYQFYERYHENQERLNVEKAVAGMDIPFIAFHGSEDETLSPVMLENLERWNPGIKAQSVAGANHTFGGKHPYPARTLPEKLMYVCEETNKFFKSI